jgi:hypothetical protein
MSVVVRDPRGRLVLYTKGADNVIFERLKKKGGGHDAVLDATTRHLADFGGEGLRTLVFAMKELDEKEWEGWNEKYKDACASMVDREAKARGGGTSCDRPDGKKNSLNNDIFLRKYNSGGGGVCCLLSLLSKKEIEFVYFCFYFFNIFICF